MKTSHFIYALIAIGLFASCGQTSQEKLANTENQMPNTSNTKMFANNSDGLQNNFQNSNIPVQNTPIQSEKKYVRMRDDDTGMTMMRFPVPNSWNPSNAQQHILLEGPRGIKVFKDISNTFYFSDNAEYNEYLKKQKYIVKAPLTSEDLFEKDYKSMADRAGNKLITSYPLRAIADTENRIDAMYIKDIPGNTIFHATVSEWEEQNGNLSVVVIKYSKSDHGQGFVSWGYTISEMTSDRTVFQQAKTDFINALIQKEVNPEYVDYKNRKAQKMADQRRMEEGVRNNSNPEKEYGNTEWPETDAPEVNQENRNFEVKRSDDKSYNGDYNPNDTAYKDASWESQEPSEEDLRKWNNRKAKNDQTHQDVINSIYDSNADSKMDESWEKTDTSGDDDWN